MVHHREMFDRWLNVARDYPDALVDPDEDLRRRIRKLDMINHRARAVVLRAGLAVLALWALSAVLLARVVELSNRE